MRSFKKWAVLPVVGALVLMAQFAYAATQLQLFFNCPTKAPVKIHTTLGNVIVPAKDIVTGANYITAPGEAEWVEIPNGSAQFVYRGAGPTAIVVDGASGFGELDADGIHASFDF